MIRAANCLTEAGANGRGINIMQRFKTPMLALTGLAAAILSHWASAQNIDLLTVLNQAQAHRAPRSGGHPAPSPMSSSRIAPRTSQF